MNVISAIDSPESRLPIDAMTGSSTQCPADAGERSHHAVAVCGQDETHGQDGSGHEWATHVAIASKLAALKGCPFSGSFDASKHTAGQTYLVPCRTLSVAEATRHFGIRDETDLFGGVVPHHFISTKVITHGLSSEGSTAPEGWSHEFPEAVKGVVLPGFSVFTVEDGQLAGLRLLADGTVRLKAADGIGGSGQWLVQDRAGLEARLHRLDHEGRLANGLVLERNLNHVTTLSVGQVRFGGLVASYYGTQQETLSNKGHRVYGGSELFVVRGGCEALLQLALTAPVRLAIEQARVYDAAAGRFFPEAYMSRRNYDIAQGTDDRGQRRSGVLEQSWRIGGASGAEIAALEMLLADPGLRTVRASTTELYGDAVQVPEGAFVYFQGVDARVGPITKYSQVEAHVDS